MSNELTKTLPPDLMEMLHKDMEETNNNAAAPSMLRAKVCKGNYCFFEIFQGKEKIGQREEILGTIVLSQKIRSYYASEYGEGTGTLPDCRSKDCVTGITSDGEKDLDTVRCSECNIPKGAWEADGGFYCREMRSLIIATTDGELVRLYVSPTSLRAVDSYYRDLLREHNLPYTAVVTKLSLTPSRTKSGFDVSKLVMETERVVTEDEYRTVQEVKSGFDTAPDVGEGDNPSENDNDDIPF